MKIRFEKIAAIKKEEVTFENTIQVSISLKKQSDGIKG